MAMEQVNGTGYSIGYKYDHNQNRSTKTCRAGTDYYTYDNQNKLTGVTGTHTKSYGYDSNGNCTSIAVGSGGSPPTTYLTYDYENRVTGMMLPGIRTDSFKYNGNDLRIQKVDSSGTHNYITDGTQVTSDVLSDGFAVYTPGSSERRSGTSAFYHGDAVGSTRDITNSSQTVTDTRRFDGFGMLMSSTGSNPTPFGFAGGEQYQTDSDSGLMLLGERYYDNTTGRFIRRDRAYAGSNWYAYCANNPITGVDPTGLQGPTPVTPTVPIPGKPLPWDNKHSYSNPDNAGKAAVGAAADQGGQYGPELGGWIVPPRQSERTDRHRKER